MIRQENAKRRQTTKSSNKEKNSKQRRAKQKLPRKIILKTLATSSFQKSLIYFIIQTLINKKLSCE
ncbi:hypothetical protein L6251_02910 [Candidatus Parcubacteria bacterium]|nr:hypothetical protein [Candidatus Parcubacteria bacterium]